MRTTATIEPDVAERIKRRMEQENLSLKRVINNALRAGLAVTDGEAKVNFSVEPHPCRFKTGIDLDRVNQLVDEMEAEEPRDSLSR